MPPKISADARKYLAVQCVACRLVLAAGSGYTTAAAACSAAAEDLFASPVIVDVWK